jgi:hypothetical protein
MRVVNSFRNASLRTESPRVSRDGSGATGAGGTAPSGAGLRAGTRTGAGATKGATNAKIAATITTTATSGSQGCPAFRLELRNHNASAAMSVYIARPTDETTSHRQGFGEHRFQRSARVVRPASSWLSQTSSARSRADANAQPQSLNWVPSSPGAVRNEMDQPGRASSESTKGRTPRSAAIHPPTVPTRPARNRDTAGMPGTQAAITTASRMLMPSDSLSMTMRRFAT